MIWEIDYKFGNFLFDFTINTYNPCLIELESLSRRPLDFTIFSLGFLIFRVGLWYMK